MSVTLIVLKFSIFICFKFEQVENILCILLTLVVLKLDKFNVSKAEQKQNNLFIFVILFVLKFDKSIFVKVEHPKNKQLIFVNGFLNIIFNLYIPSFSNICLNEKSIGLFSKNNSQLFFISSSL